MASSNRHSKPQRKAAEQARRQPAWTGARASPTFSPSPTPRATNQPVQNAQTSFPPLNQHVPPRLDGPQERLLQSLAGLTGTTITLRTKTGQHFEAVISSTAGEGDTPGVTLKDAKDLNGSAPTKDHFFVALTNIDNWASGPADAPAPITPSNGDTFRTDTDISQKSLPRPNRQLKAWSDDLPEGLDEQLIGGGKHVDDITFGPGATNTSWDQFATNEKKFGITTQFDEDLYTTKLDRTAADFKERERRAQKLANEITGQMSNNPHIAEERGQVVDDSGADEENKYGAVVRGQNAYVPPGARKGGVGAVAPPSGPKAEVAKTAASPAPEAVIVPSIVEPPKVAEPPKAAATPAPAPAAGGTKPPADALPAFRDFVTNEKQRLSQKRQALMKNDMDKRMAELVKFSQSFKLNKPIPDDLVSILAKDEQKQKEIREKSNKDATSVGARAIGASNSLATIPARPVAPASAAKIEAARKNATPAPKPSAPAPVAQKAPAAAKPADPAKPTTSKPLISMHIQAIPPFKGSKARTPAPATNGVTNGTTSPPPNASVKSSVSSNASLANANRLNVNASSFRPTNVNTKGNGPPANGSNQNIASTSSSPKPKDATATPTAPNPFFGPKPLKKGTPVNVKDDFNPFKHNKVAEAATITAMWPYTGKRYTFMFPSPPHQGQQHNTHAPPHMQPPMPAPSYEDDGAARGYMYMYPPYAYPGQPMMPGIPPPGPPGAYMPGPFMQAMPYPPGMPPPNMAMYAQPGMGQVPPPGAYMQAPPPGTYQPNNGGPRPSVPPTPIPAHAHPYYPQSPQLQHAMQYPMMMPPPGPVPQHAYEPGPNGHA